MIAGTLLRLPLSRCSTSCAPLLTSDGGSAAVSSGAAEDVFFPEPELFFDEAAREDLEAREDLTDDERFDELLFDDDDRALELLTLPVFSPTQTVQPTVSGETSRSSLSSA